MSNQCFNDLKYNVKSSKYNENQVEFEKRDIVALDPGVRTFQTLYRLDHSVEIAKNDCYKISLLLEEMDLIENSKKKHNKRKRISNLIDELHWKTISFLTTNYKTIMIPEFRISQMVKGHKLSKKIKRLMYAFKFYQFETRLKTKAQEKGVKVILVDESYTSKTCGNCGELNSKLGSKKEFECSKCKVIIDRDINGARNILLKNISHALGDN